MWELSVLLPNKKVMTSKAKHKLDERNDIWKYFILKILETSIVTDNMFQWLKIEIWNYDLIFNASRAKQTFFVKFLVAEQSFSKLLGLKG